MADFLQMAEQMVPKLIPRRNVRYERGDYFVVLEATVARTILYNTDDYGRRMRAETRDYLIEPALIVLNGSEVLPAEEDLIIDTNEGGTVTYKVMRGDAGESWRWTDRYHGMLRIHTKEVAEE